MRKRGLDTRPGQTGSACESRVPFIFLSGSPRTIAHVSPILVHPSAPHDRTDPSHHDVDPDRVAAVIGIVGVVATLLGDCARRLAQSSQSPKPGSRSTYATSRLPNKCLPSLSDQQPRPSDPVRDLFPSHTGQVVISDPGALTASRAHASG
jgi:hypothetical protein